MRPQRLRARAVARWSRSRNIVRCLALMMAVSCAANGTPPPPAAPTGAVTRSARPPGLADVRSVRHWSYPGFTRVSIELSRGVSAGATRLPADARAGRPERLYLDLDGVWVGRDWNEPLSIGDGLLQAVRLGQNTLTRTRVVIDLQRYERHRVLRLSDPDRLLIDIFGPRAGENGAAYAGEAAKPKGPERKRDAEGKPVEAALRNSDVVRAIRTVVIDPGHGGKDPGASGTGVVEKDVTLRIARRLRTELERRGFRVVLTRDDDRALDLEERTAIAEGVEGDLFVSLHCNAAERSSLRGIETWSLDASDERHDDEVAARENGVPAGRTDVLQRTVAQLRISEAELPSALLAETVQRRMVEGLRKRRHDVHDLGAKQGPFYVLFLSSMPSILIEAGFLSHPVEGRKLADPGYLQTLAESVANGIGAYRDRVQPVIAERER